MIKASQNDFEEFGVDTSTLEEMKQVRDRLAASPAIAPSLYVGSIAQPRAFFVARPCFFLSVKNVFPSSTLRWAVARCSLACVVMGGRKRG